jgi:hypothetical protein
MFVMWWDLFERLKSYFSVGLEPMSCTSVTLMARYLKVRMRKLGAKIIHAVHIHIAG